jgi:hypothetical protein
LGNFCDAPAYNFDQQISRPQRASLTDTFQSNVYFNNNNGAIEGWE